MQMNDDFSTLNCFVSSLCWLHKYWRRSVFIYCNFVIVLPQIKKKEKQQKGGLDRPSLSVYKLFHLVNPVIAGALCGSMLRIWQAASYLPSSPPKQLLSPSLLVNLPDYSLVLSPTTLTNYLTKWKSPPSAVSPSPSPLTTEHIVANESTDGRYWNGLIIFMRSWKYHWVRWRRLRLCLLPLVLWNFPFHINVRVTVAVSTKRRRRRRHHLRHGALP